MRRARLVNDVLPEVTHVGGHDLIVERHLSLDALGRNRLDAEALYRDAVLVVAVIRPWSVT